MSRSLVTEANPRVVTDNANMQEIDIDHVAINVPILHEDAANTINTFTGNTVMLSTKKGRTGIVRRGISLFSAGIR
jgi:hypothetical protein